MSDYLTTLEVVAIHDALVDSFGGSHGVRDLGALEAAVFRPRTGYYRDAIEQAAALMESLMQNHPFVDGNKRTAMAAADIHLRLNGHRIQVDSIEGHDFLIRHLGSGSLDKQLLDQWLRGHVQDLD